jgi:hypothetical protein
VGYGDTEVSRDEQIAVGADCLNMDLDVAASHVSDMGEGVIMIWSDIRGLGSVLVGPDLSVLFFASYISPQQAMEAWKSGRRTARESFAALHKKTTD